MARGHRPSPVRESPASVRARGWCGPACGYTIAVGGYSGDLGQACARTLATSWPSPALSAHCAAARSSNAESTRARLSFLRARWRPGHPRELGILAGTLGIFEEVLSRAADTLREMDPRDERSWSWRGAWTHSRSRRPVAG